MALAATIVVTTIVCGIWTWAAVLLYRAYGPALVDALRRAALLVPAVGSRRPPARARARDLLASRRRTGRLGLDLLTR